MGALTHEKISIAIRLGGVHVPGKAPTLGLPVEARCLNTSFEIMDELEKVNIDTGHSNFVVPGRRSKTYRFEQIVAPTGLFWYPIDPVGYDLEVTVKPLSTMAVGRVYRGWVCKWVWSSRGNQTQVEAFEIEGMAKYA